MAKRLVYAEDVKNEIDNWLECVGYATVGKGLSYYGELLGCIADAPTVDAVEVVRCKDCEFFEEVDDLDGGHFECKAFRDSYGRTLYPRLDDFCSYGERKVSK